MLTVTISALSISPSARISISNVSFYHCLLLLLLFIFETQQQQHISSPSALPNDYPVVHTLDCFNYKIKKWLFLYHIWLASHIPIVSNEFGIHNISNVQTVFSTGILFFSLLVFSLTQTWFLCLRFRITHVVQVLFTSDISQKYPRFSFEVSKIRVGDPVDCFCKVPSSCLDIHRNLTQYYMIRF